jgi:exodeoxyribonuclease V gamma subunit
MPRGVGVEEALRIGGMYVHRSNRMEALADALAQVVARRSAEALTPECIVVQSRGLERWLAQELASRLGIWANPDFPFPRRLVLRALAGALGDGEADADPYQPERLLWSIAALLPAHLQRPAFAPLRAYLSADDRPARRVQLAERIATVFDQYVVYRPDMVLAWDKGAGRDWQGLLWRALVARHGPTHLAARAARFLERARGSGWPELPSRISVFGVSSLPPLYVEILVALARHVELHLFLLSPSREYWAEIRSSREIIRSALRGGADPGDAAASAHLSEGNPLLASLGRVGRDFQQVLEASADYEEDLHDLYLDPGSGSMLATVQSDILALRQRGRGDPDAPRRALAAADASITVHACHSPMREVEVLYDQLRALFDADASLAPHEVVVMTPAIDVYAPYVDAVFGNRSGVERIPYRISDRRMRVTEGVIDAFLRLLDVLRGRLTAPEVLDLLGLEPIRTRFGMDTDALEVLRQWVTESGIRWGADARHRAAEGQPLLAENTWRFGLDRLLLGYAMPGDDRTLFANVLPYDDVEGTVAALLGRLAEFCTVLFACHATARQPRTLPEWRDELVRRLAEMLASDDQTAYQHQQIRDVLATLAARAAAAGFDAPVDLETLHVQIEAELQRGGSTRGFLSGGVTFCALVPMRSIPFRVVCLLGLNDADFPRAPRPLGFDLMAQRPRLGDPSPRDDDRYLFLEAVLAAREKLLITYVGQSVRDGSEIPPSVVVSELLDTLEDAYSVPASDAAAEWVRTRVCVAHPLQGFSPRYFGAGEDRRLFSYARGSCAGARALHGSRRARPAFLSTPLPLEAEAGGSVTIEQLARFYDNPARQLLQQRLLLWLRSAAKPVEDREPLALDALARWQIGDPLLRRAVGGEPLGPAFGAVRAMGVLPPGALGACAYAHLQAEVEPLAERARALRDGAPLAALDVDAAIAGTRVTGALSDLWSQGQVRYQFSQLGRRHELHLWVRHVVLNWAAPPDHPRDSFLVGRAAARGAPAIVHLRPLDDPAAVLSVLLALYWRGQQGPLPFFPQASRVYAERYREAKGAERERAALEAAAAGFGNSEPVPGEGYDEYVRQLYGSTDLLEVLEGIDDGLAQFAAAARAVFDPFLDHREELE